MKITHIAIWVKNLEEEKAFYEKYFGALAGEKYTNPKKKFQSYFLKFDDGCQLELMTIPDLSEKKDGHYLGLAHLAISVGSKENVDETTEILRKNQFNIVGEPRWTGDGYYESVVLDPEGNRVEITV